MAGMKGLPNYLRSASSTRALYSEGIEQDSVVQFACDIDDMTGEETGGGGSKPAARDWKAWWIC